MGKTIILFFAFYTAAIISLLFGYVIPFVHRIRTAPKPPAIAPQRRRQLLLVACHYCTYPEPKFALDEALHPVIPRDTFAHVVQNADV
jgi:hypothetical protein